MNARGVSRDERHTAAAVKAGFIVGPTGSGKSAIAMDIAEPLRAEIVNADSRQLYRGMDIGTAKPSPAERARIPHHLIDVRGPDHPLDVAEFVTMARRAIFDIAHRGKRALVVGGSGLYLRVLRGGIFSGPSASLKIRTELEELARERGTAYLHDMLARVDPESAARIQRGDLYRIVRALEVYRLTGVPISEHHRRHRFAARDIETIIIAIEVPRERLYLNINRRFDEMLAQGLVEEVRALLAAGYRPERPPLSTIGYREIAAFVRGETTLAEAVERAKRESRRLAKRQLTWFRREPGLIWVDADRAREEAFRLLRDFFSSENKAVEA